MHETAVGPSGATVNHSRVQVDPTADSKPIREQDFPENQPISNRTAQNQPIRTPETSAAAVSTNVKVYTLRRTNTVFLDRTHRHHPFRNTSPFSYAKTPDRVNGAGLPGHLGTGPFSGYTGSRPGSSVYIARGSSFGYTPGEDGSITSSVFTSASATSDARHETGGGSTRSRLSSKGSGSSGWRQGVRSRVEEANAAAPARRRANATMTEAANAGSKPGSKHKSRDRGNARKLPGASGGLGMQECFTFLSGIFATVVVYEFLGRYWAGVILTGTIAASILLGLALALGHFVAHFARLWATVRSAHSKGGHQTAPSSSQQTSNSSAGGDSCCGTDGSDGDGPATLSSNHH